MTTIVVVRRQRVKCILLHVRVGVGNDRLELSDMLDTWLTNY